MFIHSKNKFKNYVYGRNNFCNYLYVYNFQKIVEQNVLKNHWQ